jgi:hypothetical protein
MLINANATDIRQELEQSLPQVRALWFPTLSELERWNGSTSELYIRSLPGQRFEIGPRLESINAARLCPVFRGHLLETSASQTQLIGSLRFPKETEYLLGFWGILIALWAGAIWVQVNAGLIPAGWWFWWGILTFFWIIAPVTGRIMGGYHLQQGLLALKEHIESNSRNE